MKRLLWIAAVAAAFFLAIQLDRLRRNVDRIVIITADTMRADHLPFHGYPRPTADALIQLSEEGYVFERAYAASPDLALSLRSISTSLFPFDAAAPTVVPLLERLRRRGFAVAAFSDSPDLAPVIGDVPFTLSDGLYETVRSASDWLRDKSLGRKRAIWIHFNGAKEAAEPSRMDALAPFGPELRRYLVTRQGLPADDHGLAKESTLDRVRFHDARIWRIDRAMELFFGYGIKRRWPTVIIFTACRGEIFDGDDDGRRLDEGLVRVPLIVWFSDDRDPGKRLGGVIRHVDIWPAVAGLALPVWQRWGWHAAGRSFAGALRKKGGWAGTASIYLERASGTAALVAGYRKAVRDGDTWRLYDLRSDPLERNDLSTTDPVSLKRMQRRLESLTR